MCWKNGRKIIGKIKEKICATVGRQILLLIVAICLVVGLLPMAFQVERGDLMSFIELIIEAIFCVLVFKEFRMTRKSFEWQKEEWERQREEEYYRRINVIKKWLLPQCYKLVEEYNNELRNYAERLRKEIISASDKKKNKLSFFTGFSAPKWKIFDEEIDEDFFKENEDAKMEYENKKKQFEEFTKEKKEKLKEDLMNWILSELEYGNECEEAKILENIITLQIGRFTDYDNSFDELINNNSLSSIMLDRDISINIRKEKNDYINSDFSKEKIIARIGIEYNTIENIYNRVKKKYK